jgi:uncharacterized protein YndB with AHSA1/START domain
MVAFSLIFRFIMSSTITNQRLLAASPSQVFDAFEDPEKLAVRRGPKGFANTFDHFEFKADGKRVFVMHGPDGIDYPNESVFLEIIPHQKIVIHHIVQPIFILTITLIAQGRQTLIQRDADFESEAFVEQMREFLVKSNEENFDRLETVLRRETL